MTSTPQRKNNAGTPDKGAPRSPSRGSEKRPADNRSADGKDRRTEPGRPAKGRPEHTGRPGRPGRSDRPGQPEKGGQTGRQERSAYPKNGQGEHRAPRSGFRKPETLEARPAAPEVIKRADGHPLCRPLFAPLDTFCRKALAQLPQALDAVMPLSRNHRADLPEAIRDLSAMLTYERSGLGRSYWSAPRYVSAYLRYFLPWNLVRLTRLFPGLDLPAPVCDAEHPVTIADLGSGPLTLPLALWLSRPDWRAVPLTLVCVDTVPRPMELGRSLLEHMAKLCGEPLRWTIRLVRSPLIQSFRELSSPRLIMAGNVLNELKDKPGVSLDERMADLAVAVERTLHPEGAALFVEPGTRLGGTLTAKLRETALEEGLAPIAPCPHLGPCPLLETRERRWCHATQLVEAPSWLADLARIAKLPKDSLSLSFMLLRSEKAVAAAAGSRVFPTMAADGIVGRILSDAFPVPGMGRARYACTEDGFAIIPAADGIPSGALVACRRPPSPRRDAKTGAVELHWQADTKPQR